MKKLLLFATTVLITFFANAQNKKTVGVMFTGAGSFDSKKNVTGFVSIAPSINLYPEKSHHHLMIAVTGLAPDNELDFSLQTLNGVVIGNDLFDIYNFSQISLKTGTPYVGFGIEKAIQTMDRFKKPSETYLIPYFEVGTSFKGITIFSLGLVIHPQWVLGKK